MWAAGVEMTGAQAAQRNSSSAMAEQTLFTAAARANCADTDEIIIQLAPGLAA